MATDPTTWCTSIAGPEDQRPTDPRLTRPLIPVICSHGWRHIYIQGMLRDMLIKHFSTPRHVEQSDLRKYIWRKDNRTGILIESNLAWTGELIGKRPAILIKRNAMKNLRLALNDLMMLGKDGSEYYETYWLGSHTVFCIHGTGAATELLGSEVQRDLTQFAKAITKRLNLFRMQVTELGEVALIEEDKQNWVVPITVGWAYAESWRLETEMPKPEAVPLTLLLNP